VLGEERLCGERRTCPAVVQFQDELTGLARQVVEQQTPEGVVLVRQGFDHGSADSVRQSV